MSDTAKMLSLKLKKKKAAHFTFMSCVLSMQVDVYVKVKGKFEGVLPFRYVKLRLSGLAVSALPTEPSCQLWDAFSAP